ncbi:MAG: EF-hand domain-containing protein [Pseudomonadota bacterium]
MKAAALVFAGLLVLATAPALAQAGIDFDNDGRISLSEFRSARAGLITAADADKDDRVSPAELGVVTPQDPALRAGNADRVFRLLDTDRDGYLSRGEINVAVDRRFRSLDADGDGYLSKAERQNWKAPGQ